MVNLVYNTSIPSGVFLHPTQPVLHVIVQTDKLMNHFIIHVCVYCCYIHCGTPVACSFVGAYLSGDPVGPVHLQTVVMLGLTTLFILETIPLVSLHVINKALQYLYP